MGASLISQLGWEIARKLLMRHARFVSRLGEKPREFNVLLRTHAPQQTAFIQEPSTPRISLAASPEKREYSRHFRSHPGNPG